MAYNFPQTPSLPPLTLFQSQSQAPLTASLVTLPWTGKKSAGNPLEKIRVIAQDIKLYDIKPQNLTSDCHVVIRKDGIVDVIRAHKMVDIFDHYHDLGIRIQKIELSGGTRNPRLQSSEV